MATIKDLERCLDYEFSSGVYTGEDYKIFERKYINYLKALCKDNDWELCRVLKNHYEFSVFIKIENKFVYMSISDVRFSNNEWYNHILIRTAQSETDYSGGYNNYSNLSLLQYSIQNLINKG